MNLVYCRTCPGRIGIDVDCDNPAHEYVVSTGQVEGDPEIDELVAENQRLRGLVAELVPFMLADVRDGLALGEPPEDHSEDGCEDCLWWERSKALLARIEAGDFGADVVIEL